MLGRPPGALMKALSASGFMASVLASVHPHCQEGTFSWVQLVVTPLLVRTPWRSTRPRLRGHQNHPGPPVYFKCDIRWCDDSLLFNDLVIAIDFEARDTLLHSAGPEDFNIYGLIRRQHSQPEEDSFIVRREIA